MQKKPFVIFLLLFIVLIQRQVYGTSYDEQQIEFFPWDVNSVVYNVNAIAQVGTNGQGPGYLLNGVTNSSYWYQAGLGYNWSGPGTGFRLIYAVANTITGSFVYGSGTGYMEQFSGTVNQGDQVQVNLYFSNGNVIMSANDINTGAWAERNYSAYGSNYFIGGTTNPMFTGLMTEQYHSSPYNGTEQPTIYSNSTSSLSSAILFADERIKDGPGVWDSSYNSVTFTNPNTFNSFTFNGEVQKANAYEYITGDMPLTISAPTPSSQMVYQGQTASISYNSGNNVTSPLTYQWLEESPSSGSFTNAADCASSTSSTCSFATTSSTQTGTYKFELRVNDSANSTQNSGSAISSPVTVKVFYPSVQIKIVNTQSTATASPFQTSIVINSSAYKQREVGNLGNINFTYANGTVIPSWLENGSSNTSKQSLYWLKLTKGLPANSSISVYMHFSPFIIGEFNASTTGEAPELSNPYGQYDDGANVFNNYWAFGSLANLPSGWQKTYPGVSNDTKFIYAPGSMNFTKKSPGCTGGGPTNGITTTSSYVLSDTLVDFYENMPQVSCISQGVIAVGLGSATSTSQYFIGAGGGYRSRGSAHGLAISNWNLAAKITYDNGTTGTTAQGYPSTAAVYTVGEAFNPSSGKEGAYFAINYGSVGQTNGLGSTTDASLPITTLISLAQANLVNYSVSWIRVRAAPPNGVMPTSFIVANVTNITITNSQGSSTPAPFQQLLTVNSSAYKSYEAGDLDNILFLYANGTMIPSWLESGNSNTVSSTVYWLNLRRGIAANTYVKVQMVFAQINTNLFDTPVLNGEAPNLSSSYGQYDDGWWVFNDYEDWYGTSLPSGWSAGASNGGIVSVNNKLTISSPFSANAYAYVLGGSFPISARSIVENGDFNIVTYYCNPDTHNASNDDFAGFSSVSSGLTLKNGADNQFNQFIGVSQLLGDLNSGYTSNTVLWNQGALANKTARYGSGYFIEGASNNPLYAFYSDVLFLTSGSSYTGTVYPIMGWVTMPTQCGTATDTLSTHWTRVRAYPPNGVMPSTSGIRQNTPILSPTAFVATSSIVKTVNGTYTITKLTRQGQSNTILPKSNNTIVPKALATTITISNASTTTIHLPVINATNITDST